MPSATPPPHPALIIVDVQNDFALPDGALSVPDGEQVLPVINSLRKRCKWKLVVTTKDWHPKQHVSFHSTHSDKPDAQLFKPFTLPDGTSQMMWPDHCIQNTSGAEYHPGLDRSDTDAEILKGQQIDVDAYSGFFDNSAGWKSPRSAAGGNQQSTELDSILKQHDITHIVVCGLALDYCVLYTARDGLDLGYKVIVARDATRGIAEDTIKQAVDEIESKGGIVCDSSQLQESGWIAGTEDTTGHTPVHTDAGDAT